MEITDRLLQGYAEIHLDEFKRAPEEPPPNLHPQAAQMFAKMAEHAVHRIGSGGTEHEDYTIPVTGLALTNCLVACERSTIQPSFADPPRPDPWVLTAFGRQMMAELNLEQAARLRFGIWRCWYDSHLDCAHYRLTRRRRRSALLLLDHHAQPALIQQLLSLPVQELSLDDQHHALAASPEMLCFVTETDPLGWAKFESAIGLDTQGMSALAGFLVFLRFAADTVGHSHWYDEPFLVRLWNIYAQAYPRCGCISSNAVLAAVRGFSMAPSEAAKYLIHPPFFHLHGRFLRNPCFLGAHNLMSGLLTIAVRKHEQTWNQTLGSSLARAADKLAAMLPKIQRLKVAVRRKYPGGDVDLVLYDIQSRELLVCEVKTVYDKHRTDSLMHRFEEAKVNVHRATSQLRATERVIASGQLTLKQLFGIEDLRPSRVHMALLTWVDPVDLTMDTADEDILCLNFATFVWLVRASAGDVRALATATFELRNLWTVALTRSLELGQSELAADVEVQGELLDARASLATLPLSPLCRWIIQHMKTVDDVPSQSEDVKWISYLEDTRRVLMRAAQG